MLAIKDPIPLECLKQFGFKEEPDQWAKCPVNRLGTEVPAIQLIVTKRTRRLSLSGPPKNTNLDISLAEQLAETIYNLVKANLVRKS